MIHDFLCFFLLNETIYKFISVRYQLITKCDYYGAIIEEKKLNYSSILNIVLMVENVLKNVNLSLISVAELKRRLP